MSLTAMPLLSAWLSRSLTERSIRSDEAGKLCLVARWRDDANRDLPGPVA